jgi:SAM-dependent methyltransferase
VNAVLNRSSDRPESDLPTCVVCCSPGCQEAAAKNGYRYVRCQACGATFLHPMPSMETCAQQYQGGDYFAGSEVGYHDYAAIHKALAPRFRRRLRVLGEQRPRLGKLLDMGCADGLFLRLAQDMGWEVAGVEIASDMACRVSQDLGVPVYANLDEAPAASFDVVTLWEVLEHLPDPSATLRQVRRRLRPGGILALSTPNAAHWQAIQQPETWHAYIPPAHVILYTPIALQHVLQEAGLQILSLRQAAPLPPLPGWLQKASARLAQGLADGNARPWLLALLLWRVVRVAGWAWHKLSRQEGEIFTTLEALAQCPT